MTMFKPFASELKIEKKKIGMDHPTYFIADVAANHDGDLSRAKDLIYLAAEAGADAAKFQHFAAKTIVSDFGFKDLGGQQSHQATWKKSVFDVYDQAALNVNWTAELKATCEKAGITFFTSPYSFDLVDEVDQYVPAYKIGSGDISWHGIIEYMCKKGKPMLLATGASTADDVVAAVECMRKITGDLAIMQCNTNYTGSIENMKYISLNVLNSYREMFPGAILGLSDHTPGLATVLGAITLGARVVEKHFTDDMKREGPDHAFSMDPKSWRDMVDRSRELEAALGTGIKRIEANEMQTVVLQRRSLRAKVELKAGTVLREEHLEPLRPCPVDGVPPYRIGALLGKTLRKTLPAGKHVSLDCVE